MSAEYVRTYRAVLSALAETDPIGLADPEISLADEYEAEAREIARRVVGASGGSVDLRALIQDVFVRQFDVQISDDAVAAIVRAVL